MTTNAWRLSLSILCLFVVCSAPMLVLPLLEYLTVAPFGSDFFLLLEPPAALLPLAGCLLLLATVPLLLLLRGRRYLALAALVHGCVLAGVAAAAPFVGFRLCDRVRTAAFHDLARRSVPLVQAVRAYETEHGQPPPNLAALVPRFLQAIPGTGLGAYPEYELHVGALAEYHFGNPWVLAVFSPRGIVNFDEFLYYPLQSYPARGRGGVLERIADWAYLHE